MFIRTLKLAAVLAAGLCATAASAATFTYDLHDHPDGNLSKNAPNHLYGLRLDYVSRIFSFTGGTAQLTYDDVAGTASISGTMFESLGGGVLGATAWTVSYVMSGLTDLGGGFFKDQAGNGGGSITDGVTNIALGAKAANGDYFIFANDGHRTAGHGLPADSIVGRGWVNPAGVGGTNDFLFLATLDQGTPGTGVIPLPAAGWLLLGGLAGLGALGRRRKG